MKKYETLLFDLDDTLIDNTESIKYAFNQVTNKLGIKYTDELAKTWKKADDAYWTLCTKKKIILPDEFNTIEKRATFFRSHRFQRFFKNLSFDDAVELNKLYCEMLGVNIVEIEGAKELLNDLHKNYEIVIATNGPRDAALNKLEKASLASFVSSVVTSEEVGIGKPSIEFYEFLNKQCKNKNKDKMLMIGDCLLTDIQGGMNYKIDTCWFNKNNETLPKEYNPTMTVNKILKLKKKLTIK